MKAYAVLAGGGVKSAALVGCLQAAEAHGIQFEGFGGTSAGAILATLASVGYTAADLEKIARNDMRFAELLDDSGKDLDRLQRLLGGEWKNPLKLVRYWSVMRRVQGELGLYSGKAITTLVREKISQKFPEFKERPMTFDALLEKGCKPLKIVATDLRSRRELIHTGRPSGDREISGLVTTAVRASTSYPFVFKPVAPDDDAGGGYMIDGGLCSNLPTFLFEAQRKLDGLPVIAFDLYQAPPERSGSYAFGHFCDDMLATALSSGDQLLRSIIPGVYYIRVEIPSATGTFDTMDAETISALINAGKATAHDFFVRTIPQWAQAGNPVEHLQAQVGMTPRLVAPVLRAFVRDVEEQTEARAVRANVMLPTPRGTRIVVYQYGMDADADSDLELAMHAGCSGKTWVKKVPYAADLLEAKATFLSEWHMTQEQQNKVRPDRKAMMSFPLFDLSRRSVGATSAQELDLLGTMAIDTSTPLEDTGWVVQVGTAGPEPAVLRIGKQWADVISRLLT
jgi:NTE family protein